MKRPYTILLILGLNAAVFGFIYFIFNLSSDLKVVNFALQKEGKTYVYTNMGADYTNGEIAAQRSPSIAPIHHIYWDKEVYIEPDDLEEISALLDGDYRIHESKEPSFDGYFTTDKPTRQYNFSMANQNTENIGEQKMVFTVTLKNKAGATKNIRWSQIAMKTKTEALENCEAKKFTFLTQVQPGETLSSRRKVIVVRLKDIVDFFKPETKIQFTEKERLLYLIE